MNALPYKLIESPLQKHFTPQKDDQRPWLPCKCESHQLRMPKQPACQTRVAHQLPRHPSIVISFFRIKAPTRGTSPVIVWVLIVLRPGRPPLTARHLLNGVMCTFRGPVGRCNTSPSVESSQRFMSEKRGGLRARCYVTWMDGGVISLNTLLH